MNKKTHKEGLELTKKLIEQIKEKEAEWFSDGADQGYRNGLFQALVFIERHLKEQQTKKYYIENPEGWEFKKAGLEKSFLDEALKLFKEYQITKK